MGTNINFKSFTNNISPDSGGGFGQQPNFPLDRQSLVYSLTFDEFQNSIGKDFGSMNMDELLKNIWSAEEMQNMVTSSSGGAQEGGLQRQGSLSLPRTLSQKTVDEVWKGISNVPQRQPTLGEMTLEEFLVKAEVVTEDAQVNPNGAFFGDLGNNTGFQQNRDTNTNNTNQIPLQSLHLPLNVGGVGSNQAQVQQQQVFPKRSNLTYTTQLGLPTNTGIRGGIMGISGGPMQGGGRMGMVGLGSPGSCDGIAKSNGITSSVSPVPHVRGRRGGGAVEGRLKRMIKNRESAARSRARKQAYTMELETEVAKLKEENEELVKKQEQMIEMQKNQAVETLNQKTGKRHCLRRTHTGPW